MKKIGEIITVIKEKTKLFEISLIFILINSLNISSPLKFKIDLIFTLETKIIMLIIKKNKHKTQKLIEL